MNDYHRGERLQIMLSAEELAIVESFRFEHRMPTRAAAVRELIKLGLAQTATDASIGMKSSEYGVFKRGQGSSDRKVMANRAYRRLVKAFASGSDEPFAPDKSG